MDIFEAQDPNRQADKHFRGGRSGIFGPQDEKQAPAWDAYYRGLQDFTARNSLAEVQTEELGTPQLELVVGSTPGELQAESDLQPPIQEAA